MKKFIIITLIFTVPLAVYMFLSGKKESDVALAENTGKPGVLVFTSTMCLDCKKMKDVIKEVRPGYEEKINITNINALDDNKNVRDAVEKYGITLVPTLVFLDSNGDEKNKIQGFIPKEEFVAQLEGLLNE